MTDSPRPFTLADYSVGIGMNVLWGLNIVASKYTVGETGPFMAGVIRFLALVLICSPWLRPVPGKTRLLVLLGLFNGGFFVIFMNMALKIADNVGALAIAGQLAAPFSVIMGIVILGERISLGRAAGIVLAFAGVSMLVFDRRIAHEVPGMLLMVAAAFCWASSTLIQRKLAGTHVLTMYGWTALMGLCVLLPLSLLTEPVAIDRALHMGSWTIAAFAFSVLGATLMGQGGLAWLLGRHPLTSIMPWTLLATIVSVIASALVFHTVVTPIMIIGGIVALIGVMIVTILAPRPAPPIEVEI